MVQQHRVSACNPAPTYPALGVDDHRPAEVVTPVLRAMDADVWPLLRRAGLERACAKLLAAYHRSQGCPVLATDPPHDERLRQFHRITDGKPELPWRAITECLGWGCAPDTTLIKALTEAQMQSPHRPGGPQPTASWYNNHTGSVALWRYGACLWEMRVAAVFVQRLRLGGANVNFLARDITSTLPPPVLKTVS